MPSVLCAHLHNEMIEHFCHDYVFEVGFSMENMEMACSLMLCLSLGFSIVRYCTVFSFIVLLFCGSYEHVYI